MFEQRRATSSKTSMAHGCTATLSFVTWRSRLGLHAGVPPDTGEVGAMKKGQVSLQHEVNIT